MGRSSLFYLMYSSLLVSSTFIASPPPSIHDEGFDQGVQSQLRNTFLGHTHQYYCLLARSVDKKPEYE